MLNMTVMIDGDCKKGHLQTAILAQPAHPYAVVLAVVSGLKDQC